ncbi:type II toxin-antitoxin system VapC family toxin [Rhodohalobacter sp.]|uniref:type II toxin-antitoxin system VapC family toxin n=1 Tax=Rhodohalobacter sp. TaxID=1974210 RepID=UPI002ACE73E8|nr:type II toxin-antitoxin system VapC family toxin [Rhodohalobacter sp.]MDZ7754797.1 type II toxin-antitoxin system VapC family toxin [Rhodohalobacter sp.]
MIFLDTNICIHFLKGEFPSIRKNLMNTSPLLVKIPVIVHSELLYGVEKSSRKRENYQKLQEFLMPFEIVPYNSSMSETYAEIRTACERKGAGVGPNDLLIATIVIANNGTLVTRNLKEFGRIPGLKLTEW